MSIKSILKNGTSVQAPKTCIFKEDIARDIQTGEEVSKGNMHGSEYRAWFKERRHVEQQQWLNSEVDRALEAPTAVAEVHIALNITAFALSALAISLLIYLSGRMERHLYASYVAAGWMVIFNHAEILALLYRRSKPSWDKNLKPGWLNTLDVITAILVTAACILAAMEEPTVITTPGEDPMSIDPWRLGIIASEASAGGLHLVFAIFAWIDDGRPRRTFTDCCF
ncbi:hypothetical protein BJ170DRAFT_677272 [Xylariales sp. AK1849]|nr:hypothetical protein BJ170DRAFT_677272 [Xylariales sp. AK1849]